MDERGHGNRFKTDSVNWPESYIPGPIKHAVTRTDSTFAAHVWEIMDAAGNLLLKKHEAYGPKNISQSPGGPENGLRVRMWDKMARLNHILENPEVDVNDESLEDTLKDLLNYCAIFIMVRNGTWPAQ